MDFDLDLKLAIYRHVARTTRTPRVEELAAQTGTPESDVRESLQRLFAKRLLVLEADGVTIRMAPPFSGVATQHLVTLDGKDYFANCAWDALGIPAALNRPAQVLSRCERTREPLRLTVSADGPAPEPCVVHFAVPAAQWWKDIVYT
jgi:hypothetical protein